MTSHVQKQSGVKTIVKGFFKPWPVPGPRTHEELHLFLLRDLGKFTVRNKNVTLDQRQFNGM